MSKSILITGCSSGIGKTTALNLKQRGYRVFATARKSQDVVALQQLGLESLVLDVSDVTSIRHAVTEILTKTQNTLDVLCNNAGYAEWGAVADLDANTLRRQFETNLFGVQELTHLIIPVMRAQGHGKIIQISSLLGLVASFPLRGAYTASKFALEGLTDTLRVELRGTGISVSLIEPGPIKTSFQDNAMKYSTTLEKTSLHYQDQYAVMKSLNKRKKNIYALFMLPPEAVSNKIIKVVEAKHPRAHYYVGALTHLMVFLKKILPTNWLDAFNARVSR